MKSILIIYPHWPPSNLAGVHRSRLIANYLHSFNWNTTLLTVDEKFYEEQLDYNFCKLVSENINVIKVSAFPIVKPRIIGDIGIRGFIQLYKAAKKFIQQNKCDFIWIPIPSFYSALLGRLVYEQTKTPYGIDYIDPWVRDIHNRKNYKSILSLKLAKILEPIAVKKASLISGVSFEYYKPVLEKNFNEYLTKKDKTFINKHTNLPFTDIAMPYGFDPNDHEIKLNSINFPWKTEEIPFVYAGAYLPNSRLFMKKFMIALKKIKNSGQLNSLFRFYFLGTGAYEGESIKDLSIKYEVSKHVVEIRIRFNYLEILSFLSNAKGIIIIGSTEKHYTASKTFQAIMSEKKIFSIFHKESSAITCLEKCEADTFSVRYSSSNRWVDDIEIKLRDYLKSKAENWQPKLDVLKESYSSYESAKTLVEAIQKVI